jgi:hypothetical protein
MANRRDLQRKVIMIANSQWSDIVNSEVHVTFFIHGKFTLVYKKKNIFSVTCTKVGELNSIFYAEFKYVLSFSLSRKVFK